MNSAAVVQDGFADLFVTAGDGLRLHARDYAPHAPGLAVVCLAGLTRNATDFADLARALAGDPERPRRVLALDYRGRGRSEWDPDSSRYDLRVEAGDALAVLTAAGVEEAVFVGTSRGGLITMLLSGLRPALIRGAVLNDIGPVIEADGLTRLRATLPRRAAAPSSYEAGAALLAGLAEAAQFPDFGPADWQTQARGTWSERDGRLELAYDPALLKTLDALDPGAAPPPLWPLFGGLTAVPVLVLRGDHSDILSEETLAGMQRRHPALEALVVPGQGHAPALHRADLVERIGAFVRSVEDRARG